MLDSVRFPLGVMRYYLFHGKKVLVLLLHVNKWLALRPGIPSRKPGKQEVVVRNFLFSDALKCIKILYIICEDSFNATSSFFLY